uniref:C2H2-type domain-containing protein n=1 Tax=Anopheles atroparvus TaxID=41427 RepID=A0A182J9Y1_ANOAO
MEFNCNLATHVKTVHQKLAPFKCTHCNRSFGKKESLKRHIMTHTGERPHECTTCGKRFIQLVALQSHARVHNNLGKS